MRLLLDTHFAIWTVVQPERLTPSELAMTSDRRNDIAVSAVSIWELRLKWDSRYVSGERKGPAEPAREVGEVGELPLGGVGAGAVGVKPGWSSVSATTNRWRVVVGTTARSWLSRMK